MLLPAVHLKFRKVIHDRIDVRRVEPLTERQYVACGCTALLDAIGEAIHHIGNVHKYAREVDRPEHTLFVITTDGMENASRHYGGDHVKQMMSGRRAATAGNSCSSARTSTRWRRPVTLASTPTAP